MRRGLGVHQAWRHRRCGCKQPGAGSTPRPLSLHHPGNAQPTHNPASSSLVPSCSQPPSAQPTNLRRHLYCSLVLVVFVKSVQHSGPGCCRVQHLHGSGVIHRVSTAAICSPNVPSSSSLPPFLTAPSRRPPAAAPGQHPPSTLTASHQPMRGRLHWPEIHSLTGAAPAPTPPTVHQPSEPIEPSADNCWAGALPAEVRGPPKHQSLAPPPAACGCPP